jgi:hypothetical protein
MHVRLPRVALAIGVAISVVSACGPPKTAATPLPSVVTRTVISPGPTVTETETAAPTSRATPSTSSSSAAPFRIPKMKGHAIVTSKWGKGSKDLTIAIAGSWRLLWAYQCPADGTFTIYHGWSSSAPKLVDFFGVSRGYWNHDVDAVPTTLVGRQHFRIKIPSDCRWGLAAAQ